MWIFIQLSNSCFQIAVESLHLNMNKKSQIISGKLLNKRRKTKTIRKKEPQADRDYTGNRRNFEHKVERICQKVEQKKF